MEYEIGPIQNFSLGIKELWSYRELFYFFAWRDIKVKYKQTFLGFAWVILQPLFLMIIFTLFFGRALKIPSNNLPYPVFVLSGLVFWTLFSTGLTNASNSMVAHAGIIKKIYFPRFIIPLSSFFVSLFDFAITLIIFIPIILHYKISFSYKCILYFPISVVITSITTIGLSCLISSLIIKYRDFKYVLPFFLQGLLFITPVIYSSNITNNYLVKFLFYINPISGAIELFRCIFSNARPDWNFVLSALLLSCVIFIIGTFVFRKK